MQTTKLLLSLLFILSLGTGVRAQEVLTDRNFIRIDQFGYPTTGSKVAVIANAVEGYNAGEGIRVNPGVAAEVVRDGTDEVVFSGFTRRWNGGSVDDLSGDRGAWFDFTALTDTGTFRIRLQKADGSMAESYAFRIADDVYHDVLRAATQFFYYQRINQEKTAEYASGAPWTDAAWYDRPNQEYAVKELGNPSNTRSMPKGWFDAGDPNKYVTFAVEPVHALLTTFDQYPDFWSDFDLNIPESGNDVPDLLDEIRWETDWIISMQDFDPADGSGTGGLHQKMGILEDVSYISPPSIDTRDRWFNGICVSSTITGASMLAHAAYTYQEAGVWPEHTTELIARAEAAWDYYIAAPNKSELCDNGQIEAGDADGPGNQYATEHRALATAAAVYLFALTGDQEYDDFVQQFYNQTRPWQAGDWGVYRAHQSEAVMFYTALPNADPATRQAILDRKTSAAKSEGGNYLLAEADNLYRSKAFIFNWGSNSLISRQASDIMDFQVYGLKPENHAAYQERAQSIINYLHGTNPSGTCMLSNMYRYGGDLCADEMWHSWFGLGSAFDNLEDGNVGPAPGFISGGPNPQGQTNMPIKLGVHTFPSTTGQQPGQKAFSVENYWEFGPWAYNEPAIYYQAAYIKALAHFAAGELAAGGTGDGIGADNFCAEAEDVYTVLNDAGTTGNIDLDGEFADDSGDGSVGLTDQGDAIRIPFTVTRNRSYDLALRVLVEVNGVTQTSLGNEYVLTLDGEPVDYIVDSLSFSPAATGPRFGEIVIVSEQLVAGEHMLDVSANVAAVYVDALCLRDPNSVIVVVGPQEQAPFNDAPAAIPGIIEAEEYDLGGQGVAYNDTDESNNGGAFRTDESVDIGGVMGGGFSVGWVAVGEWIEYTVDVSQAGTYAWTAQLASPDGGGRLRIRFDGNDATGTAMVPMGGTGGWNSYTGIAGSAVTLAAGVQILRFEIEGSNAFNIDRLVFEQTGGAPVGIINYQDGLEDADAQFSGEPGGISYEVVDGYLRISGDGSSGQYQVIDYALRDENGGPELANAIGSNDLLYIRARTVSGNTANLRADLIDNQNLHTTNASRAVNISGADFAIYTYNYAGGYEDGGYGGTDCTSGPCAVDGLRIERIGFYPEPVNAGFNETIEIDWISFGREFVVSTREFASVESLSILPNPTSDAFGLRFELAQPALMTAELLDPLGRSVRRLFLGRQQTGEGFARFDVSDLPAGTYFLRMTIDGRVTRATAVVVE